MGKDREKTSGSQRALTLISVWLLSAAAAVAFGRLFSAPQATVRMLTAGSAAVALSVLMGRRHLVLAGVVSACGLLVALGLLVFPGTLRHGLPTLDTFGAITEGIRHVGPQARTQVAPTPSLTPLMLAAISAVWASAFASHALAARAGSPLLASLPPLALFTFADAVLDQGSRPGYTVLLLAGILAVVFADGVRRVRQWGPIETWRSPARGRISKVPAATRGAPSVGALVLGIAVLAPGLLPGWGSEAAFETQGVSRGSGVDPLVSLRAELQATPERPLFEVTASSPAYWRLLSLDRFDGVGWSASELSPTAARDVGSGGVVAVSTAGSGTLHQEFRVQGLSSPWLPMAYRPISVTLPGGELRYADEPAIAAPIDPVRPGTVYHVESSLVSPTPAELDAAYDPTLASDASSATFPDGFLEYYTQLPEGTPPVVRETALKVTADASNGYRKMLAIQGYLRTFTYFEDVTVPRGTNPLLWFLTESRAGFCQQFSGAMAAMARSLGYPARVAVGFTPGDQEGDDRWQVSTGDAHAWPEIYFAGIGWVAFEPTPGRDNPAARTYLVDLRSLPRGAKVGNVPGNKGTSAGPPVPFDPPARRRDREGSQSSSSDGRSPFRYWWMALAALLSLVLAALLSVPPVRAIKRRHLLRSAKEPRDLVLAGYRVFEEKATDAGFGRAIGQTLVEYRDDLHRQVVFSENHFDRLVAAAVRAAYSTAGPSSVEASRAIEDERVAARELRGSASLARRLRGNYRVGTRFRS